MNKNSVTLAIKFCSTFQDRAKVRGGLNSLAATISLMRQLQSDYPFTGRWIIYDGEPVGVEFVFADGSTCSTFYDRPGQLSVEPLPHTQPRIFT